MTAIEIVDDLLESSRFYNRKKQLAQLQSPEHAEADEFYRSFMAKTKPGEKIEWAGNLAAYTHDWPEFEHWLAYNRFNSYGNPSEREREEQFKFYHNPEAWANTGDGTVYYQSKDFREKGLPGTFYWAVEWSRSTSTNWTPQVTVNLEWWDKENIWQHHYKQPFWSRYKQGYTQDRARWDAADPELYHLKPVETTAKIKQKLILDAKAFLERLSKIAKIDKVRWNVPELFQESWQKEPSSEGFVQIGGDANAWEYGGVWFREKTGDLVKFDGMDSQESKETESNDSRIDTMLTLADYSNILKQLTIEDDDKWEETENDIRQAYADKRNSERKFLVYRTSIEDEATLHHDWPEQIDNIKHECGLSDEDWAAMPIASKNEMVADQTGWHEWDHQPVKYTKAELSVYLGIDL